MFSFIVPLFSKSQLRGPYMHGTISYNQYYSLAYWGNCLTKTCLHIYVKSIGWFHLLLKISKHALCWVCIIMWTHSFLVWPSSKKKKFLILYYCCYMIYLEFLGIWKFNLLYREKGANNIDRVFICPLNLDLQHEYHTCSQSQVVFSLG